MLNLQHSQNIHLKPIGFVKTQAVGDEVKDKLHQSEIHLERRLLPGFEGIKEFSHIFVIYWLHEVAKKQQMLKVHPRGRTDLPLVGVFATRTKLRPNRIGLTLCELISVKDNVLTVRGLDAFNGSPVLDLKPYDSWDCALNAKVPQWWLNLEAEKSKKKEV